jgi:flavin-binding protein dodecin
MSIAKTIEISAESPKSFEDAINSGLKKAATTVENIESAWIKDQIVTCENGAPSRYRVHMKVTFRVR